MKREASLFKFVSLFTKLYTTEPFFNNLINLILNSLLSSGKTMNFKKHTIFFSRQK